MVEIYLRLMVKMLVHYHSYIIITSFKHHKVENRNMSHSITYQSEHFLNCKHLKFCCQGDLTTSPFCLQIDAASVGLIWLRLWSVLDCLISLLVKCPTTVAVGCLTNANVRQPIQCARHNFKSWKCIACFCTTNGYLRYFTR